MRPELVAPGTTVTIKAETENLPQRIDVLLTQHFPAYSRNYFQNLIDQNQITVNKVIIKKSSLLVKLNDILEITFPASPIFDQLPLIDTKLGVEVMYEHPDFLIVYKPPHLIVHPPSRLSNTVTLVHWLINHFKELKEVGAHDRPGIVHRLDKDTSGILIVPRNNYAHMIFSDMFKNREIKKTYLAVVENRPPESGMIDSSIGRHIFHKHKMAHDHPYGRKALTYYSVLEYFRNSALVEVNPVTGRTHQIRVHLASIGCPIIGDATYGSTSELIDRQALHAYKLSFEYLGHLYTFWHDMPLDMKLLIDKLSKNEGS